MTKAKKAKKRSASSAAPAPTPATSGKKLDTRFKPGPDWTGNAAGRPKGSKHKLSEEFVAALCEDFEQHGSKVIEKVRRERPSDYLRVIASVVPKELTVNSTPYEDMSDEALFESLERVRSRAAALIARGVAPGTGDGEGAEAPRGSGTPRGKPH